MTDWVNFFKKGKRSIFNQCLANRHLIELIIMNSSESSKILEAGCGTAMLSFILADLGYDLTALDLTEDVLGFAKSRVNTKQINLKFQQGDILKLSSMFEKKYFDIVCHSGVMEHFSDENIIKSLTEQRIISNKVIFNIPNDRNKYCESHIGDERFFSNKKWVELIKAAGFKNVKVYGGYDLPKFTYFIFPGAFFHRKVSFWWKYLSKHSVFVCKE